MLVEGVAVSVLACNAETGGEVAFAGAGGKCESVAVSTGDGSPASLGTVRRPSREARLGPELAGPAVLANVEAEPKSALETGGTASAASAIVLASLGSGIALAADPAVAAGVSASNPPSVEDRAGSV